MNTASLSFFSLFCVSFISRLSSLLFVSLSFCLDAISCCSDSILLLKLSSKLHLTVSIRANVTSYSCLMPVILTSYSFTTLVRVSISSSFSLENLVFIFSFSVVNLSSISFSICVICSLCLSLMRDTFSCQDLTSSLCFSSRMSFSFVSLPVFISNSCRSSLILASYSAVIILFFLTSCCFSRSNASSTSSSFS